jgi:hypothetical protein
MFPAWSGVVSLTTGGGGLAGRTGAKKSGDELVARVRGLAEALGLQSHAEVPVGRRIWGAVRRIDVVLTNPRDRRRLGVECKAQDKKGSTEEKIPTTIQDIAAWPIPGIVVFSGEGLSKNMRGFLTASGKAVEIGDLEGWLRLYFGLELPQG